MLFSPGINEFVVCDSSSHVFVKRAGCLKELCRGVLHRTKHFTHSH